MGATPKAKFEDRLKAMPAKPGVYIFRDAKDKVIYVGKAALLRNRVRSYFGSMHGFEEKTRRLVGQIADIDFILTGTVQEALLLEATLVKRHQPFFNVRLKDDKHYPYLKIDLKEQWPRVEITRRVLNDGARYFGPFASAGSVRRTLDLVKKLFPWRSCTKVITGEDPRPCLEYYIHRCVGPCASLCTKEEYDTVIRQTIMFLEGRTDEIGRDLRREMQGASEALEYERAARLRDQVQAIERTTERQVMEVRDRTDMDVFGLARAEQEAYVQVWFVRRGNVIGRDNFQLDGTVDEPDERVLGSFIEQFYESAPYVPRRVLLPIAVEAGEPRPPAPLRRIGVLPLEQLQDALSLPELPARIECYDISNIQGTSAVGSMVVFVDGHPKRSEYRRFGIKGVAGQNDFAMMQEVLKRRFWKMRRETEGEGANEGTPDRPADHDTDRERVEAELSQPNAGAMMTAPTADGDGGSQHGRHARATSTSGERGRELSNGQGTKTEYDESFQTTPDLVIVDGGKGQVSAAHDAMRNLGVGQIPLAGLAKRFEELYVKDVSEPIVLDRTSQALYLVQRVRDEAHRFAITYHRGVRSKAGIQSALDAIQGIGPKRKKALLRKFGSVKGIREAGVEEIAATPGFTKALAEKVLSGL